MTWTWYLPQRQRPGISANKTDSVFLFWTHPPTLLHSDSASVLSLACLPQSLYPLSCSVFFLLFVTHIHFLFHRFVLGKGSIVRCLSFVVGGAFPEASRMGTLLDWSTSMLVFFVPLPPDIPPTHPPPSVLTASPCLSLSLILIAKNFLLVPTDHRLCLAHHIAESQSLSISAQREPNRQKSRFQQRAKWPCNTKIRSKNARLLQEKRLSAPFSARVSHRSPK